MMVEEAWLITTNEYSYRPGVPARIIGVGLLTPKHLWVDPDNVGDRRLCYNVRWSDGMEDWIPIHDKDNYKVVSFEGGVWSRGEDYS